MDQPNILAVLIAIFATFRIAQFIVYDDAPFGIMDRTRLYFGRKAAGEKKYSFWWSIAELINCPFCVGLWVSLLITPFIFGFQWYSLLFWLAIAGGQAWLESMIQTR